MKNSSGFHGYPVASLYPDMGDMMSQTMITTPDPEEIEALSGQEPEKYVKPAVNTSSRKQIWMVLGALGVILLVFGIPKG